MRPVCSVLLVGLTLCLLLLSHSVVIAGRKATTGKGGCGGKVRCKGDTFKVSACSLGKRGFKVSCGNPTTQRHVAALSVVGVNGADCRGLSPDLFVQMSSCFWKQSCTIRNSKGRGTNYMLKLFQGEPSRCIIKEPKTFHIRYECTRENVPLLPLLDKDRDGQEAVTKERVGILRSHEHHPWMYKRRQEPHRRSLTLSKPSETSRFLGYTIRNLSIADHDNVTVSWTKAGRHIATTIFDSKSDVTTPLHNVIVGADDVTFRLVVGSSSYGGEGFVVCFRWMETGVKADVCADLIEPEPCKRKGKKKQKHGQKADKKGRRTRKRERRTRKGRDGSRKGEKKTQTKPQPKY